VVGGARVVGSALGGSLRAFGATGESRGNLVAGRARGSGSRRGDGLDVSTIVCYMQVCLQPLHVGRVGRRTCYVDGASRTSRAPVQRRCAGGRARILHWSGTGTVVLVRFRFRSVPARPGAGRPLTGQRRLVHWRELRAVRRADGRRSAGSAVSAEPRIQHRQTEPEPRSPPMLRPSPVRVASGRWGAHCQCHWGIHTTYRLVA